MAHSAKLSFLYREWPNDSQPGALDASHKGPCAVYMKAVGNPTKDTAIGDGWFKIWEDGYDAVSNQWCTEKLIANNGFLSVNIPADLSGGYYLVRPELLTLQQADKTPANPQFYVGCAQIFLDSAAIGSADKTVSIPGYVSKTDPSVLFNLYTPKWPYPMPGPHLFTCKADTHVLLEGTLVQTIGLLPNNVVVTNANWAGIELDTYSDEAGCWNVSNNIQIVFIDPLLTNF